MFTRMKQWISDWRDTASVSESPVVSPPSQPAASTWTPEEFSRMNKNACSQVASLYIGETATFVAETNCMVQVLVALKGEHDGLVTLDIAGLKTDVAMVVGNSLLVAHSGDGILLLAEEAIEVTSKCQGTVAVRFAALDVAGGA